MNKKVFGDDRPVIVDSQTTISDWAGKNKRVTSKPAIVTQANHLTHYEIIVKIANYHAEACRDALQTIINAYGADRSHSITFDNDSEFSLLNQVQGTQIYFTHPYSPRERRINEYQNNLIQESLKVNPWRAMVMPISNKFSRP